jgi:anti-sigma B factor antagonist
MDVSVETAPDDGAILRVRGDLDFRTVSGLEWHAAQRLAASVGALVVDLSGVDFRDSTGLRALVVLLRKAQGLGVRFSLAAPSEAMRMILHLSGFDGLFTISETG